jgi:hypothetical protein
VRVEGKNRRKIKTRQEFNSYRQKEVLVTVGALHYFLFYPLNLVTSISLSSEL